MQVKKEDEHPVYDFTINFQNFPFSRITFQGKPQ